MNTTPNPLGRLPPESEAERLALASIGRADIAALFARIRGFKRIGGVLLKQGSEPIIVEAVTVRRLLVNPDGDVSFDFNRSNAVRSGYTIAGTDIEAVIVKGASDAVAREAAANIGLLADRLQRGEIGVSEFYAQMQVEVKYLHLGESGLARGGVNRLNPSNWAGTEARIAQQYNGVEGRFPGLRAFARDIEAGRYGEQGALSEGVLSRSIQYANAGRGGYENELTAVGHEAGRRFGKRVRGAGDSCPTCLREGGVIRLIEDLVAICDSECGSSCFCSTVTAKTREELEL